MVCLAVHIPSPKKIYIQRNHISSVASIETQVILDCLFAEYQI